jgi:hypothetical protein
MIIKKMLSQYRRDFQAIYECEECGHEEIGDGYDDTNFHENVIPRMKCGACDESSRSLGKVPTPRTPRYPEGKQI